MKRQLFCFICVLSFSIFTALSSYAGDWRFPLGLSYATSLNEVNDLRYNNLDAIGYDTDDRFTWPVGFTFQPYYEFDNGIGIGTGIGPGTFSLTGDYSFTNVPVGLDLRYAFLKKEINSPYIRIGARYNIAGGDFIIKSYPGVFGAIGYEFSRIRTLGIGIEVSYDASEVEFKKLNKLYYDEEGKFWDYTVGSQKLRPCGIMVSFYAVY